MQEHFTSNCFVKLRNIEQVVFQEEARPSAQDVKLVIFMPQVQNFILTTCQDIALLQTAIGLPFLMLNSLFLFCL